MRLPKKILVIKLSALGDFIQALGAMAAIRQHHPEAEITLLTTKPFVKIGEACGYFDHVLCDERPQYYQLFKWNRLRKTLNQGHFSRVYDLQNNDRTGIYFRLFAKKPEWVGKAKGASHRNSSLQDKKGHAFDRHIQTLKLAGIENVVPDDLSWVRGDVSHLSLPQPYILLVPGCAPSRPEKRWDAAHYGVLSQKIMELGYHPVVIGSDDEKNLADVIRDICLDAIDLTGKTELFDLIPLARGAAGAVGNDTGPMHIIGQTGCLSCVLFSRHSDPEKHAPLGTYIHVMQADPLDDLTPTQVMDTLEKASFFKL